MSNMIEKKGIKTALFRNKKIFLSIMSLKYTLNLKLLYNIYTYFLGLSLDIKPPTLYSNLL